MATAYYQNVDELWSKFKQELSALLQTAYQLPEALQVNAAMEMEETLFMWKTTLKQNQPSTDQPSGNVSPDVTYSPPSSAVTVAPEQLGSEPLGNEPLSNVPLSNEPLSNVPLSNEPLGNEPLSNEPLSNEPLGNEPLNNKPLNNEPLSNEPLSNDPLTDGPQVKFTECKAMADSDSGDEELVIAITDVPLVDSGSSDDDTTWSEDTAIRSSGGSTTPPGRKTAKRKCSPRKRKSDSGTRTNEQHGTDKKNKIEAEEEVGNTAQPRKRGRPRKGVLMRPKQTGGSYCSHKRTYRKIGPKAHVKLESDKEMTTVTDIPVRKRGRPKRCSSDEVKIWTHKCDICCKLMATKTSLAAHIRVHTGEKPYQCEECGKSFSQISGLSVHRKRHRGTKDHHCRYCGFAAIQSIDISRHEMRHHTKEKPYLCDLCGRGFIDVWSLKNHINTHSKHKKDYVCDKCDFKTHSPDILRAHTRNMHQENRKTFKCPICDLVLRYQDTFTGHMRRHYGEKPFACKVCGASFASNSQLAAHKRIHQERLFACTKCNKKFINPHKLRRHEVVHTDAKEFKCPVCTYMCNVKSNLKKHCTAVHKIEYPPPDMKRIKIVPIGTKDNSGAADFSKIAGNSGSCEAAATSGSEHTPCKTLPNQQVCYLDESKVANDIGTTGQILDQQEIASKLHPGNASLVADKHDNDAGNFLLFINECGTSNTQNNTSRSDVPVQQNLIVMPPNSQVTERTNINVEPEDVHGYYDDNVCELRFEQV